MDETRFRLQKILHIGIDYGSAARTDRCEMLRSRFASGKMQIQDVLRLLGLEVTRAPKDMGIRDCSKIGWDTESWRMSISI
jgi:hypothetical protein